jgi:hypothetical protein
MNASKIQIQKSETLATMILRESESNDDRSVLFEKKLSVTNAKYGIMNIRTIRMSLII